MGPSLINSCVTSGSVTGHVLRTKYRRRRRWETLQVGSGTSSPSDGPSELVAQLADWAQDTAWVDWLELAGSLGRGAGDHWSDVDAGIGVNPDPESRLDSVEEAV